MVAVRDLPASTGRRGNSDGVPGRQRERKDDAMPSADKKRLQLDEAA